MWRKHHTKVGLPDKGFDAQNLREFQFIGDVVDTHGLDKVCEVYSSYNLTLMREFYCEISVTPSPKIKIRGVTFKLTARQINEFLNLSPPKNTEYHKMMVKTTPQDLEEASALLGKPKAE
ncbi:hypothetical protein L6452_43231 [Arctium lappa]|uniref:Uncharacterized protein n=1 Tax=Arctium lappa TaxID=4217 RepID=A0ACB8XL16_ARCLA|nr:hypothetical protein L6452_43231 [Arctium lappa]